MRGPSGTGEVLHRAGHHVGAGGGLVLSLRADHLGDLAPYRTSRASSKRACTCSARCANQTCDGRSRARGRAGLRLEPGLVELMVRDVEGEPAGLPMLSHVLRETWERREGPTLTVDGYRATGASSTPSRSRPRRCTTHGRGSAGQLRSLLLRLVMPTRTANRSARECLETRSPTTSHRLLVEHLVGPGWSASTATACRSPTRRWSGCGPDCGVARRRRRWAADIPPPRRRRRRVGRDGTAGQRALPGRPAHRTLEWRDRWSTDLNDTESAFLTASAALVRGGAAGDRRPVPARTTHQPAAPRLVGRGRPAPRGGLGDRLPGPAQCRQSAEQRARRARSHSGGSRPSERPGGRHKPVLATSLLVEVAALGLDDSSAQVWENLASTLARPARWRSGCPGGRRRRHGRERGRERRWDPSGDEQPVDGVQLYDAKTLAPVPFDDDTRSSVVRFSPDGRLLAAAVNQWPAAGLTEDREQPVRLYDLPGGGCPTASSADGRSGGNVEYSMDFSGTAAASSPG